jgi:hypothetical protein
VAAGIAALAHGSFREGLRVTADKFRSLALEISGAIESSHMNHPDFRIEGRIFASLGYPDDAYGMVKLAPEEQRLFLKKAPKVFAPCAGAWGRQGSTSVHLAAAKVDLLRAALEAAAKNVASRKRKAQGAAGEKR